MKQPKGVQTPYIEVATAAMTCVLALTNREVNREMKTVKRAAGDSQAMQGPAASFVCTTP